MQSARKVIERRAPANDNVGHKVVSGLFIPLDIVWLKDLRPLSESKFECNGVTFKVCSHELCFGYFSFTRIELIDWTKQGLEMLKTFLRSWYRSFEHHIETYH